MAHVRVTHLTSEWISQSPLITCHITFQFTEFLAPNGVKVKVEVDAYYDDPVRNKIMHPNGGPAFSYRYDIFDIGTMDQPNIFKCAESAFSWRGDWIFLTTLI